MKIKKITLYSLTFVVVLSFISLYIKINAKPVFAASTIVVNSTADDQANDGECTLREAIVAANSDAASGAATGECVAGNGNDTINFNISNVSVDGGSSFTNGGQTGYTIQPTTQLQDITEPVTINGYSQPNSQANTAVAPNPLNGRLLVEIDGSIAGGYNGLNITGDGDNSVIKGLVINNWNQENALFLLADNVSIQGNYIGTDPTGLIARPNSKGINGAPEDPNSAHNTLIGGLNPQDRNLISGNTAGTYGTASTPGTGWVFQGNYIGVGSDGLTPIANGTIGGSALSIYECQDVVIGGNQSGAINVFGASLGHGISPGSSSNILIEGNYIGLGYEGATVLGNVDSGASGSGLSISSVDTVTIKDNLVAGWKWDGISIGSNDTGVSITGNTVKNNVQSGISVSSPNSQVTNNIVTNNTGPGIVIYASDNSISNNTIAHNGGMGVLVNNSGAGDPDHVSILGNSIFDNGGLGIELGTDGVTPNDANDSDSGPNGLLNFPIYTSINEAGGNTTIDFSLDVPVGDYRIEFFSNTAADSSGNGEGETYLGFKNITSTGSGSQDFSATLTGVTGVQNLALTTTQITVGGTGFGSSSEFGGSAPLVSDLSLNVQLADPTAVLPNATVHYTATLTNNGPSSFDLSNFDGSGVNPLATSMIIDFLPPDLAFVSASNTDITCTDRGTAYNSSLIPGSAHAGYTMITCAYTGSGQTLLSGQSISTTFTVNVSSTSALEFTNYAFTGWPENDPDSTTLQSALFDAPAAGGSGNMITFLNAHLNNNFSVATFPVPVSPDPTLPSSSPSPNNTIASLLSAPNTGIGRAEMLKGIASVVAGIGLIIILVTKRDNKKWIRGS